MLKKILIIIGVLLVSVSLCLVNARIINTKQLTTNEKVIITDKLSNTDELLVAYFSDLHYGTYINNEFLDKVTNKINDFSPDIIIFGGDLIDRYSDKGINEIQREHLIMVLKNMDARFGKYAVFGEDDLNESGTFDDIKNILIQANFKIINDESLCLSIGNNDFINIIGINSLAYSNDRITNIFANTNTRYYTFVVAHYPDTYDVINTNDFDYMLAGHSHGGQIYFPLISLFNREEGCEKYYRNTTTNDNKTLDISNGVGRTGRDARFNADASINFYRLEKTKIESE